VLVQVVKRRPAQLAIPAINAAGFGFKLMTNILIGLNIAARRRRNLGIANLAVMLRIVLQQRLVGEKTLRQPLE
jgi:hypothetical protein